MDWRDVWRSMFPKRMIENDVQDEISFHIEERIRDLVRRGWEEDRARAFVLERFGDVESVEEECREYDTQRVDGDSWRLTMEAWSRDVRLALRSLRRSMGFTALVVTTLALGIGATTAVFSVLEGVVLRALPFPAAERLAVVWQNDRATGTVRENASTSDYYDYLERVRTFDDLAIHATATAVLTRNGAPPLQLNATQVSRNLPPVLRLEMQAGRNFTELEDQPGGPLAVILSDRAWRDLLGSRSDVLGQSLNIDGRPHEVVGILPPGIDYPDRATDIWLPIQQSPAIAQRPSHWVTVLGRLADGANMATAQADLSRIMADLEVEFASDNENRGAFVEPLAEVGRGDLGRTLWVLFGAVMAVLAIACVNVANLLLARGATRLRELAVLKAIGAGAAQITRRFFVESMLITGLATVAGIALAAVGVRVLSGLAPAELSVLGEPQVNGAVLGFAVAVSLVICIGFGLLPSVQARGIDLQKQLKDGRTTEGGSASLGVRRLLVAAQLSLAVVLLLGATLLIGTVRNLQQVDPGFRAENTLRMDFALPDDRYPDMSTYPNWPEITGFIAELEAEVETMPGVSGASVVLNHPLDRGFTNSFRIEGQAYDPAQGEITTRLVTPGYFETAGVPVLEGRLLDRADRLEDPATIVVNQTAARRYFPDASAVGQRIGFWGTSREIVGVVADEKIHGLTADTPPAVYVSLLQTPPRGGKLTLMVQAEVAPQALVDGVREVMRSLDPDVPIFNVATMEATLDEAMARERFASTVLAVFAAVAVFLALLGVHGVLAYLVAQRGHEVGVRMALGATKSDVVQMVVKQGVSMTVVGIAGGVLASIAVSGIVQSQLFGVSATAPLAYFGVAVGLGVVALVATIFPAYRAASTDPATSLRSE